MVRRLSAVVLLWGCLSCSTQPDPAKRAAPAVYPPSEPRAGSRSAESRAEPSSPPSVGATEAALGVVDRGIYPDLDGKLQLEPPSAGGTVSALLDRRRELLVVYVDGAPRKVYPAAGTATISVSGRDISLRPGDALELRGLLQGTRIEELPPGAAPSPGDRDGDGIPDPLDVLIGAHKAALNGAHYSDDYFSMGYPNGDAPRDKGACVDVVVRAIRNAGLDLQAAVAEDLRRDPAGYAIKQADRNIDHRRVRNVLHYFKRHWQSRSNALDDPGDPLAPGDIVFLDTFSNRTGPEHLGVLSDQRNERGLPLVINNWTFGHRTQAMDLLSFVKVTHRFRFPSRR